jgi:hypothetical protein
LPELCRLLAKTHIPASAGDQIARNPNHLILSKSVEGAFSEVGTQESAEIRVSLDMPRRELSALGVK